MIDQVKPSTIVQIDYKFNLVSPHRHYYGYRPRLYHKYVLPLTPLLSRSYPPLVIPIPSLDPHIDPAPRLIFRVRLPHLHPHPHPFTHAPSAPHSVLGRQVRLSQRSLWRPLSPSTPLLTSCRLSPSPRPIFHPAPLSLDVLWKHRPS